MTNIEQHPRPTWPTPKMVKLLAEEYGKLLNDWSEDNDLEGCIEDCKKHLRRNRNGYELAKDLEYKGYYPDAELVEILDSVDDSIRDLEKRASKEWVLAYEIKADFAIGDSCMVKYGSKSVEGIIDGIDADTAHYKVIIPSDGMSQSDPSKRRAVIKFENATPLVQSVES